MAIDKTIKEYLKVELGCPEKVLPKKVLPKKAFGAHAQPESPTSSTQLPLSAPNQSASKSPKSDETSIAASTP